MSDGYFSTFVLNQLINATRNLTAICGNTTITSPLTVTGLLTAQNGLVVSNGLLTLNDGLSVTGGITGTILTPSQTNITSIGTLPNLTVTGTTTTGTINSPTYLLAGSPIFSANTLGPSIVNSSLTSLGILNALSLATSTISTYTPTVTFTNAIDNQASVGITNIINYINLGAVKLLWGRISYKVSVASSALLISTSLPFAWTGIPIWGGTVGNVIGVAYQYVSIAGLASSTQLNIYITSYTTMGVGAAGTCNFYIIGT